MEQGSRRDAQFHGMDAPTEGRNAQGRNVHVPSPAYRQIRQGLGMGLAPDGLVQRGRIKPRVSFRIPFRVAPLPAGPSEW
jgi:hypothetical protein